MCVFLSFTFIFFFFQAEDGIRDFHVTGVQTCALPISHASRTNLRLCMPHPNTSVPPRYDKLPIARRKSVASPSDQQTSALRSPGHMRLPNCHLPFANAASALLPNAISPATHGHSIHTAIYCQYLTWCNR